MSTALTPEFSHQLLAVLPQLLAAGALPDDWNVEATTYDLNRFRSEDDFVARFVDLVDVVAASPGAPGVLRAQLAACGLPTDYARLGQPLSTVVELLLQAQSGARHAVAFASRTKPWLSIVERYASPSCTVRVFTSSTLPVSTAKKQSLLAGHVELHEHHVGPVSAAAGTLTVWVTDDAAVLAPGARRADATVLLVAGGGVTLIDNEAIDFHAVQLVRKRTSTALLAVDAHDVLARAAHLPVAPRDEATHAECEALLSSLFPELRASATFHTGLAAEAAVFTAAARLLDDTRPVKLLYAENGYGGTCQLIAQLLKDDGVIDPVALPVLGTDGSGQPITLVDRMVQTIEGLGGAPAMLFLETPTNPQLQVHDFPRLFDALRAYQARFGVQLPVLADTTLAPLFPLLAQPWAQDWPCVIVKSGSKYFTRGKATLGVAFSGAHALAQQIIDNARAYAADADTGAKPTQLFALAEGLRDLQPRMARIAANTTELAAGLRAALLRYGHEVLLYTIGAADTERGLSSGMLSFYLPKAPTTYPDLVDEFVDHLLQQAPSLVKNRVSYGQSTGGGRPDVFYVINPEESTQGSLSAEVKNAQKRNSVQICRVSVPEHADVPGLLVAIESFLARKYPSPHEGRA
jgi:cystathionine beta-lyase/cystathionine gamma-synthase